MSNSIIELQREINLSLERLRLFNHFNQTVNVMRSIIMLHQMNSCFNNFGQFDPFLYHYKSRYQATSKNFKEKENEEEDKERTLSLDQDKERREKVLGMTQQRDYKKKFFTCEQEGCGKSYKSKENLNLHIQNKHLGFKPYKCEYCDARFSHRNGKNKLI